VKNIVKVRCNLRIVGKIEEISQQDNNTDWLSNDYSG